MMVANPGNVGDENEKSMAKGNLFFKHIIQGIQHQSTEGSTKKERHATLLVLGSESSGKRTVVRGLQNATLDKYPLQTQEWNESMVMGLLDFAYIGLETNQKDASYDKDYHPEKINVWLVKNVDYFKSVQAKIKNEEFDLLYTAIYICLNGETPWLMSDELSAWLNVIRGLSAEHICNKSWAEQNVVRGKLEEFMGVEADSGELMYNLGFPVYVLVNKPEGLHEMTDVVQEAIAYHLRLSCIPFLASVMYCKNEQATYDALYALLMNYWYQIDIPSDVAELVSIAKSTASYIYIPLGWDNVKNLEDIKTNNPLCADCRPYDMIVMDPIQNKKSMGHEAKVEDTEEFLTRVKDLVPREDSISVRNFFQDLIGRAGGRSDRDRTSSSDENDRSSINSGSSERESRFEEGGGQESGGAARSSVSRLSGKQEEGRSSKSIPTPLVVEEKAVKKDVNLLRLSSMSSSRLSNKHTSGGQVQVKEKKTEEEGGKGTSSDQKNVEDTKTDNPKPAPKQDRVPDKEALKKELARLRERAKESVSSAPSMTKEKAASKEGGSAATRASGGSKKDVDSASKTSVDYRAKLEALRKKQGKPSPDG